MVFVIQKHLSFAVTIFLRFGVIRTVVIIPGILLQAYYFSNKFPEKKTRMLIIQVVAAFIIVSTPTHWFLYIYAITIDVKCEIFSLDYAIRKIHIRSFPTSDNNVNCKPGSQGAIPIKISSITGSSVNDA